MWNPFGRHDGPSFIERHGDAIMGALGGALLGRVLFNDRDTTRRIVPPPVVLQPQPRVEPLGPFEVPAIPNNRTPFTQLQAEYRQTVSDDLAELEQKVRQGRLKTLANVWNPNQLNTPWHNTTSGGKLFSDVVSDPFTQRGGVVFQDSSSSADDGMYGRSRSGLANFQAQQHADKEARKQSDRSQRSQQVEHTGIGPSNESGAAYQLIHPPVIHPFPRTFDHSYASYVDQKEYLNRLQVVINKAFQYPVFKRHDIQYPYTAVNGIKAIDRNIFQMAAVYDAIVLGETTNGQWQYHTLRDLEAQFHDLAQSGLTPEQQRALRLAAKINDILKHNEELGSKRDDAKAFTEGFKVIIDASQDGNGQFNSAQIINDMKLFMIDQRMDRVGFFAQFRGFGSSNAAFNLLAGPRNGTKGWNEKFWDYGKQYYENGELINQVHHFAAFFIEGYKDPVFASNIAFWLDLDNKQDRNLGYLAISMASRVKNGEVTWDQLSDLIYEKLRE